MTGSHTAQAAAILFAVTAVLFAIGARSEPDGTTETQSEATEADGAHDEAAESDAAHEDEQETVLGVDAESPATVGLAVTGSLVLAAMLWLRPLRQVAVLAVAAGLAFAALDLAEVAHQIDESHIGLAALAATIALGHTAAAITSGLTTRPANAA